MALTFAVLLPTLLVAHHVGDFWVQTSGQAATKSQPGWPGRLACAAHVATYTLTQLAAVVAVAVVVHLHLTTLGLTLGLGVSAVSHYVADRRLPLARLADALGLGGFWRSGTPPLASGAYALDQAWHWAWLGAAALVTAGLS